MSEKIIDQSALNMYENDQAKYSIIVNRRRAIPDIRDGLKPIQRRILYCAFKDGLLNPSRRDKSASLTGLIMRYCHPHGDSYGSIVVLANWFKTKYPLMYGYGNWGNVSGSGAAAARYTETALSDLGYELTCSELSESQNIVNWIDTYKRNGDKEPEYLPVKVPLLLINGSFGIGVGLSVGIPSHNLVEVIEATRVLLKNPNANITLIPDLCQPCDIFGGDWDKISATGTGSFKVRGKIITEQNKNGSYTLHIVSLPDDVSTTSIYDKILEMVEKKQLPMIKDIFNALNGELPDITIHLKQGADPEYVKQIIYSKTSVQKTVTVNFQAVGTNGIDIERFSYKDYLLTFIQERMNTKFRLYCNKMQQAMTRHHRIDAFIKVLESGEVDNIIKAIRKKKDTDTNQLIEFVIKKCKVTDLQAKFIIESQIGRLSLGHLNKYREERNTLDGLIRDYYAKVTDDGTLIRKELDEELVNIAKKYGTPRLCKIVDISEENQIPAGTFKIVITEKNFIRKIPDVDKINIVRKDNPKFILRIDNRDNLLLFDNMGKVFSLPVHKIPISDKQSPGVDIRILIRNLTADVISVISEPVIKAIIKSGKKHYFTILTKYNLIKKLDLEDFTSVNPSGLIYTKVLEGDEVVGVSLTAYDLDIVACSGKKALRMPLKEVPLYKRNSLGSKAMSTTDPLTSLATIYPGTSDIVVVTKNGKFNRFSVNLLSPHNRARKGGPVIKLDPKDEIFTILGCNETDKIRILTSEGAEEVLVADIKPKSNIAKGTKMISIKGIMIRADVIR